MKSFAKPILIALTLGLTFTMVQPVFAQSTRKMQYLTVQERENFSRRLQRANVSSERSKVTAEMNRIIQKRQFDERKRKIKKAASSTKH